MPDVLDEPGRFGARSFATRLGNLTNAVRAAGPPLLFGVRLWASVCLALYVAFWLELDNPYWAGTTAAIVCQPSVGASLRKGWFRMIGTVGRRGDDRGADRVLSPRSPWFPREPRPVGCCMRARGDAAAQLRGICGSAGRLHGGDHRKRRTRCGRGCQWRCVHRSPSSAPAKSASASSAPESSSPEPISVARVAGWRPGLRRFRPKSPAGSPPRSRWSARSCRKCARFGATSSGASSRSTP